uniref:Uncharacterized protein n=1 Tax=viral metagenome TaxID=1070528 RepID=A0A6C0I3A6_9ZZZZ
MAKTIEMTHMDITVLWRYPKPKGRNDPSSLYRRLGFIR